MPKGHYIIQQNRDTSFRSCVCILGIFAAICGILVIIFYALSQPSDDKNGRTENKTIHDHLAEAGPVTGPRQGLKSGDVNKTAPSTTNRTSKGVVFRTNTSETITTVLPVTVVVSRTNTSDTGVVIGINTSESITTVPPETTETEATTLAVKEGTGVTVKDAATENKTNTNATHLQKFASEEATTPAVEITTTPAVEITTTSAAETRITPSDQEHPAVTEIEPTTLAVEEGTGVTVKDAATESKTTTNATSLLKLATEESGEPWLCDSFECKRLAARTLSLMSLDASGNPCSDFYSYACGGLSHDPFLLPHDYWTDVWTRIEDQAKKINKESCESYRKFQTFLSSCSSNEINSTVWETLVNEELETLQFLSQPLNYTHIFLQLINNDSPLLFDVQLDVSNGEDSKFKFKIVPASTFLSPKKEIADCERISKLDAHHLENTYDEIVKCTNEGAGLAHVLQIAKTALEALQINETLITSLIFDLESFLKITYEEATKRKIEQRYIMQAHKYVAMDSSALKEHFPWINWKELLGSLIGREFGESEEIYVYDPTFYKDLLAHLSSKMSEKERGAALLAAYVTARYRALLLPPGERDTHFCARRASSLLRGVAAALYLDSFDAEHIKRTADITFSMFNQMKTFLQEGAKKANWMKTGRNEIMEKIDLTNFKYPDPVDHQFQELQNKALLDEQLRGLVVDEDNYISNTMTLMRFERSRIYDHLREEKDPRSSTWTYWLSIFENGGKSIYSTNTVVVPLGMMAPPFFHPDYPPYLQYAGLGFAIAHEIAHHYDLIGIHYNKKGDYSEHAMVDMLSLPLPGTVTDTLSGQKLTYKFEPKVKDNEFFADLTGIQLAFETFQSRYVRKDSLPYLNITMEQAFFVHLAQRFCTRAPVSSMVLDLFEDVHFPPPFRVAKMAGFSYDFGKAFACKDGRERHFPHLDDDTDSHLNDEGSASAPKDDPNIDLDNLMLKSHLERRRRAT